LTKGEFFVNILIMEKFTQEDIDSQGAARISYARRHTHPGAITIRGGGARSFEEPISETAVNKAIDEAWGAGAAKDLERRQAEASKRGPKRKR
jgi:hypothetical protein